MSSLRTFTRSMRLVQRTSNLSQRTSTPLATTLRQCPARAFSAVQSLREKFYTQSHEWIELDGDKKIGSIGVSAHAANALGDVVYVELPQKGASLKAGDSMGAVESVKSASDLYVPVAGTIIDANATLEETPGLINKSPENEGWIAKIELADGEAERISELMNAEDYKKFSE